MLDYINEDHITVRTDIGIESVDEKIKMPIWFYSVVKDLCNYYGLGGNIDPAWVMKCDMELVETYLKKIGLEFEKFKLDKLAIPNGTLRSLIHHRVMFSNLIQNSLL